MPWELKQPEVNIGVVGHVDHGKTTLVQALTGVWTSRHSEEIERGMTIKLGYADGAIAYCSSLEPPESYVIEEECPDGSNSSLLRRVSYVDVPGHEALMATMLSGAALMDGAILVVAANEQCPQPQTREHFVALDIIGVRRVIVVQNKVDVVTREEALKNYEQIKSFLKGTWAEEAPIIPISALHRANIDVLLQSIEEVVPTPERDSSKPPLMFIARSFEVNKPGTPPEKLVGGVIGGSIMQGAIRVGDEIEIRPGVKVPIGPGRYKYEPLITDVTSLRFGEIEVKEARPGGLVAIGTSLDPSLTKADALIGSIVGKPGHLPPVVRHLSIEYKLMERVVGTKELVKAPPMRPKEPIVVIAGTAIRIGSIEKVTSDELVVTLRDPLVAWEGSRVAISRQVFGRWRLIGHGVIESIGE